MTLYDIFEITNFISGKFPTGATLPPARLNLLIPEIQDDMFYSEANQILKASLGNPDVLNKILSASIVNPFKKNEAISLDATGSGTLPKDYNRYLILGADYNGGYRRIDIISENEYLNRRVSALARAEINPFAKIGAGMIYVVPFDVGSANLDYLSKPKVPYFDWCQDGDNPNKLIYMPTGSYINSVLGVNILYDVNNDLIASNVTKDMNVLPYVSKTVELEWETYVHFRFVSRLLRFVGVNLGEAEVEKFAQQKQQEGA
jgi:hypothetical protein